MNRQNTLSNSKSNSNLTFLSKSYLFLAQTTSGPIVFLVIAAARSQDLASGVFFVRSSYEQFAMRCAKQISSHHLHRCADVPDVEYRVKDLQCNVLCTTRVNVYVNRVHNACTEYVYIGRMYRFDLFGRMYTSCTLRGYDRVIWR